MLLRLPHRWATWAGCHYIKGDMTLKGLHSLIVSKLIAQIRDWFEKIRDTAPTVVSNTARMRSTK